jgi:hypothetical protein
MNRVAITALFATLLVGCAKKDLPTPAPEPVKEGPVGRYQLVSGEREITEFSKDMKTAVSEKEKVILRIDTVTGKVDRLDQTMIPGGADNGPSWLRIKD